MNLHPLVSVIMPVRNEACAIERGLGSVLAQDYPPDRLEILVVDGMSTDGTREVVQRKIAATNGRGPALRLLDNPQHIVPTALNLGVQHARGEVIFRLDGHSEMAPDYVRTCVRKLQERPDVACVGGPSVAVGAGWLGGAYALALRSAFGSGGRTFRTLRRESCVDTVAFGGYRRDVFATVGGFDPALQRNQDIDFNARLRKAGGRLLLIAETRTLYYAPDRLGAIIRQNYKNGYWNTLILNQMAQVLSWRHFVPCLFVTGLLLAAAATLGGRWGWLLLLLLVATYALATLTATAAVAARDRCSHALLLPLVFPTMHVSYGLGSLIGLCQYLRNTARKVLL